MKNILAKIFLVAISATLLIGCIKAPSHSMFVKNSYPVAMSDVKINNVSYGQIESGATTDYKPLDEGSFTISGTTVNGQPLTGGGSVSGKGIHKWTMTITSTGGVAFEEDK